MAVYPRRCKTCRHRFDVICDYERREVTCIRCGLPTETDWSSLTFSTEASVHGSAAISRTHSVIPQEVQDARRMFEPAGVRIRDDGKIEVPNGRAASKLSKLWAAAQHAAGCKSSSGQFQTPDPKKGAKLRKERFLQRCRARGLKKR